MATGQFKDYYYPNNASARSLWYHDHANNHTAVDAYFGQNGFYFIYDPAEDVLDLPRNQYDLGLALSDKTYQANGDLVSPASELINWFGDTIHVNGQPWPYLNVEPRKYRLRVMDCCLSRPFDLYLHNDKNGQHESFQVIASDSGLFGAPVTTSSLEIAMGERYEIVVDFAPYANSNITLMNDLQIEDVTEYQNTDKIMRFVVGTTVKDSTHNSVPSTLSTVPFPPKRDTIDHVFNFQRGSGGWSINGVSYTDVNARVLARPAQGTVENWQFRYEGGPGVHPVHMHLIDFQIISRSGGRRTVLPYETAGLKDVVLLEPGEVVNVVAMYGPWNGLYQFHCHNLIHEDHNMMAVFNVTALAGLGYTNLQAFDDPMDPRFLPQDYNAQCYTEGYIADTVLPALYGSGAYSGAWSFQQALDTYYADHPYGEVASATSAPVAAANAPYEGINSNGAPAKSSPAPAQHAPAPAQNAPAAPPAQHAPAPAPAQNSPAPAQNAPAALPAQHAPAPAPTQNSPAPAQHAPAPAPAPPQNAPAAAQNVPPPAPAQHAPAPAQNAPAPAQNAPHAAQNPPEAAKNTPNNAQSGQGANRQSGSGRPPNRARAFMA